MRILLRDDVDRNAFDAAMQALGFSLLSIVGATTERPRHVIAGNGQEFVYFVEDHRVPARYLLLSAQNPEPFARVLSEYLPFVSAGELRVKAEREDDREQRERYLQLARAAEGPGEPDWPGATYRPRLSSSVFARINVVDGVEKVVLYEPRAPRAATLDMHAWALLQLADGTRDIDALSLALTQQGIYSGEAKAVQLLSELHVSGMLVDGLAHRRIEDAEPTPTPTPAPERVLEPLPGYSFRCDGGGGCCRFYGSVGFSLDEAERARPIAKKMDLPVGSDLLFAPGSGAQSDGKCSVALVNGRCIFLEGERCGIQARGGLEAKPLGCQYYPATLSDDGETVRVSVKPECSCVFASIGVEGESELLPVGVRTARDLPWFLVYPPWRVRETFGVAPTRETTLGELRSWSNQLAGVLATDVDTPALMWTLADEVEEGSLASIPSPRAIPIERAQLWMDALARRARASAEVEQWRSPSDLCRRVAEWIAHALEGVDVKELLDAPHVPAHERFYIRALAHSYSLPIEGCALGSGLRDRGTRLLAARAMEMRRIEPVERATEMPLAPLEAAMRAIALQYYLLEVS